MAVQEPQHTQWKGKTGGTTWMQKALVFFLGWMNLPFVYSGMALVIPFYMIFNRQGYLSQYHFFHQRLGYAPLKAFWNVYLNHFTFGQIILDRFAVYGGAKFKVVIDGNDIFMRLIDEPGGFVQLGSHIGNFELAGYMLSQDKKPINALIFGGETGTVMQNRERIFEETNIRMIAVGSDMTHVFEMNRALEDGEIVSMPGDRIFGSQKSLKCNFFGADAAFPMGPFILAATRQVPLISIFVMKDKVHQYHIYVRKIEARFDEAKGVRETSKALAQDFAEQLEAIVRKYPHQWFNYFDFWNQ